MNVRNKNEIAYSMAEPGLVTVAQAISEQVTFLFLTFLPIIILILNPLTII